MNLRFQKNPTQIFLALTLLVSLCRCSHTTTTLQATNIEVATSNGIVRGEKKQNLFIFKGIPYATPPTGELRWKPTLPVKNWIGVFDATQFGPACPQLDIPGDAIKVEQPKNQSEDCLSLNIWTTAAAKNLPVLVYLHGGGRVRGSGSLPSYDGSNLAGKINIVVITMNFRLGPFPMMAG